MRAWASWSLAPADTRLPPSSTGTFGVARGPDKRLALIATTTGNNAGDSGPAPRDFNLMTTFTTTASCTSARIRLIVECQLNIHAMTGRSTWSTARLP